MTNEYMMTLYDIGRAIYDAFSMPGDFVLLQFANHAPALALSLGIDTNSNPIPLSAILSALIWLLLALVVRKFFLFLQNVSRSVTTACRTVGFRTSLRFRTLKAQLLGGHRQLVARQSNIAEANPELEIDDIDLAVLRNSAAAGGSFVVSAPDLAEQLTLRPARVQRSLLRLTEYRMVEVVFGSTDGFDNYRLSPLGAAFLAALERSANAAEPVTADSLASINDLG